MKKFPFITLCIMLCGTFFISCKTKKEIQTIEYSSNDTFTGKKVKRNSSIKVQLVSLSVDNDTTSIPFIDNPPFSGEFMPPRYKGGWKELINYLEKNTHYHIVDIESGIQGKVRVSFSMDKHGNITNTKFIRALTPHTDKEIIKSIKAIPNIWLPAIRNHEYINSQLTVDFFLKLEEEY